MRNTLVLGASLKSFRYSNLCVRKLAENGIPVIAVGLREGFIENTPVYKNIPENVDFHTITIYLGEENQRPYYDAILLLNPVRVILNPGAENKELKNLLLANRTEVVEACTIMMLEWGQF